MHFVLAVEGTLRARAGGAWIEAAGVLTPPDLAHEIDARGREVLLVFLDPESEAGAALAPRGLRAIIEEERARLVDTDPLELVTSGVEWCRRAVRLLGAAPPAARRRVHPRVRKVLRLLSVDQAGSLETLAAAVDLSPGRLMHVFTASIGIPLRPYLAWLKLQRAAGAIVAGVSLAETAHAAGFADAAHMTRTFRRMFGVTPSQLRPRNAAS
jgi:AraC-like DNA-binding protein